MDGDTTAPPEGQSSDTASDDFKILYPITVDPKEGAPWIEFLWRGQKRHAFDYICCKWCNDGKFGLTLTHHDDFMRAGIKCRKEHGLAPWPGAHIPAPTITPTKAPEQLHEGSKLLQSAIGRADTLAEHLPRTAPKKEHIDSMLAVEYDHELVPIQEIEEELHFTPQFILNEDGEVNLFDPDGPLAAGQKAKELRHASPNAGALADLIVSQIRIEAVELSPNSDSYQLMWYDGRIYRPGADKVIASCVQTIMGQRCKKELVNETVAYIERMKHLLVRPVERSKICVLNGILDLDTRELVPFRGDMVFTSILPIVYDGNETPSHLWKFLDEVLDPEAGTDPEGKKLDYYAIMEFIGTMLEPGYRSQKGAILLGLGANGKSVLLSVLTAFLGPDNVAGVSMEDLAGRDKYAAADLMSKKANICADISDAAMRDTATLKKALGGDVIRAQRKYGQPFNFTNEAKMIFSCNSIPETDDLSIGWTRRWLIFNFPRQFTGKEADPNLVSKLTTPRELSGLLNEALDGRERWIKQGYFTGHDDVEKDRERYLMASDPSTSFLARECYLQLTEIREGGMTNSIPETDAETLYLRYVDWCKDKRLTPATQQKFGRKVQEVYPGVSHPRKWLGDRKKDGRYVYVWYGLGLNNP